MSAATIEAGSVLGGKFLVQRRIGIGGMGAVYEVEHTLTKHRRALKLLNDEMARMPGIVARFLREASAAGHIGNPHVVETFDAGMLDSGEPYIVMELLQGRTLSDLVAERRVLPLVEACEILLQACDGVGAAHAAGIVHRDIKPENLFLLGGAPHFVKILDFGISKFDPALTGVQGMTVDGSAMGTPYYMPPEQARGEKTLDAQADVYALGVVLYECICGAKPFDAETLPHLAVLIAEGKYLPPSSRRPELPRECDRVIATAMAANRAERFRSVTELASAIGSLLSAARGVDRAALPFAGTLSLGSGTPQSLSGVPAQTGAPLSRTTPSDGAVKKPSRVIWLAAGALVVLAMALAVAMGSRSEHPAAAEASVEPSPVVATPPRVSDPSPEVMVAPASAAPATTGQLPAGSVKLAAPAPPGSERPHAGKKGATRVEQHGLSEENPF